MLTGFPWLAFGYANVESAYGAFAPIAGVYAVSFVIVLTAAAILAAIMGSGAHRWVAFAFIFLPWIAGAVLQKVEWTEESGNPIRTTILQAGIPQDQKWFEEQKQKARDYYRDETRIAHDSELVVWPEVAIPSILSVEAGYLSQLQSDARESGQTILLGILEDEPYRGERLIYNSVVALDGTRQQVYRKRHLVPFGEYFPVPAKVREWMRMMNLPYSDLSAGEAYPRLIETADGERLSVAICYEDAYGSELLYTMPDAGILVNVSNDAWFGRSIAPFQHLQIAQMRSLEFGRATVRATNTGISTFISHRGVLSKSGPQFEETTLTEDVMPRRGSTPYVSFGNRPILGSCLVILGIFWFRTRS